MGTPHPARDHHGRRPQPPCGGPLRPTFSDDGSRSQKPDYKTAALCKQVRRLLTLALAGDCGDPVLQALIVDDVLPAPHAGRLLVRLYTRVDADGNPSVIDILTRLSNVEGILRAALSQGIARKRTPELAFDVRPITSFPEVPHD